MSNSSHIDPMDIDEDIQQAVRLLTHVLTNITRYLETWISKYSEKKGYSWAKGMINQEKVLNHFSTLSMIISIKDKSDPISELYNMLNELGPQRRISFFCDIDNPIDHELSNWWEEQTKIYGGIERLYSSDVELGEIEQLNSAKIKFKEMVDKALDTSLKR